MVLQFFGFSVLWLFLFIYLVIWFSIYSVPWIRSTGPAHYLLDVKKTREIFLASLDILQLFGRALNGCTLGPEYQLVLHSNCKSVSCCEMPGIQAMSKNWPNLT